MKAKVLTIGSDQTLVNSRASILSSRYETATARPEETLALLRAEPYNLLLVCHSIPSEAATAVVREAHHEFPHLCIVRLLTVDHPIISKPIAHKIVTVDYRPEVWIRAVDELLAAGTIAPFTEDCLA